MTIKSLLKNSSSNSNWVIESTSYRLIYKILFKGYDFCIDKDDQRITADLDDQSLASIDMANQCLLIIADLASDPKNLKNIMDNSYEQMFEILEDTLNRTKDWFLDPKAGLMDSKLDIESQNSLEDVKGSIDDGPPDV